SVGAFGGGVGQVVGEVDGHRLGGGGGGGCLVKAGSGFFGGLVCGVPHNRRDLDDMIAAVLVEDWTIERLETLLACILRAGAHELADRGDIPARVVISEYVDLADAFYGDKETGLVNGVLDRLARELMPAQPAGPGDGGKPPG